MQSAIRRICLSSLIRIRCCFGITLLSIGACFVAESGELVGRVLDAESGELLPSRVYVQSDSGEPFTVSSQADSGSAVVYDVRRGQSQEVHTTLSAHPFSVELPKGRYELTVERGKEYVPSTQVIEMGAEQKALSIHLERWSEVANEGWFSGDTHVHRSLPDLPNLIMAEDLNVALPLTYWVTEFQETPLENSKQPLESRPRPELITVNSDHVIWPVNTEYEIFTVNRKRHTLGAVFLLNHREPLDLPAHPVKHVAKVARQQGAILDLDKHNWPWSMMLLPVADVDLYELTNNHLWRTSFLYGDWYPEYFPEYLNLPHGPERYSEESWIRWGFHNYYALLNCGFDLMPSAGTASGVHPVPLGFGRVYVHLPQGFDFDAWMAGLEEGRSFVTTGPMLDVRFNGHLPGARFQATASDGLSLQVAGQGKWYRSIEAIELVVNGKPIRRIEPEVHADADGELSFVANVEIRGSSWVAVRCFARTPDGRLRFAHSAPVHVDVKGRPLRARKAEAEYLVNRVAAELERHQDVLPPEALAEYAEALRFYRDKLDNAR